MIARCVSILAAVLFFSSPAFAEGKNVMYQVNGEDFAGNSGKI